LVVGSDVVGGVDADVADVDAGLLAAGEDDELELLLPQPTTPRAPMHPTTANSTAERRSMESISLPSVSRATEVHPQNAATVQGASLRVP
jgi:hypothetical protein